jgi:DNA polymerase-4
MPDWERAIAHVDMDAFYASIEIRDDPSLAGKPVVVGGATAARGVVSAASYEARKYGIHSAMPMAQAERRCPHLVRLRVDFVKYQSVSQRIMEILHTFSPLVEPLSLDEAFLDLSGMERSLGSPPLLGRRIKDAIRDAERLTASIGIAPVKFVAKIASDLEKPDGFVVVLPGRVEEFLRPLPLERLWGVGPRTREELAALGLRTIGELAACDRRKLTARFGQHGEHLHRLATGVDEREVVPDWEAKSYSHEETFERDLTDGDCLEAVLLDQAHRVARRLRRDGVIAKTVQLKLRYHDFRTLTRQTTLRSPTADAALIYEAARMLFQREWNRQPVRLIGAGVQGVVPVGSEVLDLFVSREEGERRRRLVDAIDRIEDRFGRGKVIPARLLDRNRRGD